MEREGCGMMWHLVANFVILNLLNSSLFLLYVAKKFAIKQNMLVVHSVRPPISVEFHPLTLKRHFQLTPGWNDVGAGGGCGATKLVVGSPGAINLRFYDIPLFPPSLPPSFISLSLFLLP